MSDETGHTTPGQTVPEAVPPATSERHPGGAARRPWMIAAATGVAGVVVGGVLGATLSSAGAQEASQQGPGTGQVPRGQQGGPPGQQSGTSGTTQQGRVPGGTTAGVT